MSGVDRIAAERATHEARGYTAAADDQWDGSELVKAAICHASPFISVMYDFWPWDNEPPSLVFNVERRIEQLAKAGALIAAEIDRLERFAESQQTTRPKCEAPGGCDESRIPGAEFCQHHQEFREKQWPWLREARIERASRENDDIG